MEVADELFEVTPSSENDQGEAKERIAMRSGVHTTRHAPLGGSLSSHAEIVQVRVHGPRVYSRKSPDLARLEAGRHCLPTSPSEHR